MPLRCIPADERTEHEGEWSELTNGTLPECQAYVDDPPADLDDGLVVTIERSASDGYWRVYVLESSAPPVLA